MRFERKYTYEHNLAKGEYTCHCAHYPPMTGKTKSTARSKMLRQIRRHKDSEEIKIIDGHPMREVVG